MGFPRCTSPLRMMGWKWKPEPVVQTDITQVFKVYQYDG